MMQVLTRFTFCLFLLFVVSCGTSRESYCRFYPEKHGWMRVASDANHSIASLSKQKVSGTQWYTNAGGDFLICGKMGRDCGSFYEVFRVIGDGEFMREHIVCMT